MPYGKIDIAKIAETVDRQQTKTQDHERAVPSRRRRFPDPPDERPIFGGRVCECCNLRRTANEFLIGGVEFENCSSCWRRHGRKKRKEKQ